MDIFTDANILITVFSRKGSKGLPGKHMKLFNGRPLIAWTFDLAKEFAEAYGCEVVSVTDSADIVKLSTEMGIDAIRRNPGYATDKAGKVDAIRDFFLTSAWRYDLIIDLDATNPCRTVDDIGNSFAIFCEKEPKTLFSATKAKKNPYFNQIQRSGEKIVLAEGSGSVFCRQDVPEVFDINSNIYIYDCEWLLNSDDRFVVTDDSAIYIMPDSAYCDIDTETDFKVAELLHREYYREGDVRSKEKDCACSRGQRIDWFGDGCCPVQAMDIAL